MTNLSKLSNPKDEIPTNYPCGCRVEFNDKDGNLRRGIVTAIKLTFGSNEGSSLRIDDEKTGERLSKTTDGRGEENSYIPFDEKVKIIHDPYKQ